MATRQNGEFEGELEEELEGEFEGESRVSEGNWRESSRGSSRGNSRGSWRASTRGRSSSGALHAASADSCAAPRPFCAASPKSPLLLSARPSGDLWAA